MANLTGVEVRTIRESESEEFLRLLCEVFGLDFDRAHGIFLNEPLFDLDRKWALFEGSKMISLLTTVPLEFGWGNAIGIAGVATAESHRSRGHAGRLIKTVLNEASRRGEGAAYLFAKEPGFYERLGFEVLDEVIRARVLTAPERNVPPVLGFDDVKSMYETWASESPARLRRPAARWAYWKWNLRVCTPFKGGYLCAEGGLIRECVTSERLPRWPIPLETHWLGLRSMADRMAIPIVDPRRELHLMGYQNSPLPQMFMTDQF